MENGEGGNTGGGKTGQGGNRSSGGDTGSISGKGTPSRGGDKTIGPGGFKGRASGGEGKTSAGEKAGKPGGTKPGEKPSGEFKPPSTTKRVSAPKRPFVCGTNTIGRSGRVEAPPLTPAAKREAIRAMVESREAGSKTGTNEGKTSRQTEPKNETLPDVSGKYRHECHTAKGKTYQVSRGFLYKPGTVKVHKNFGTTLKPGEHQKTGMERGHLLAGKFGTTARTENHVPQNSEINNGTYKKNENAQTKLLRQGFRPYATAVAVTKSGEKAPFMIGVETQVYAPDGKTLIRTDRLHFTNHLKPPTSDGTGVKGKLVGGAHRFNQNEGNVIRVGRFQGGKQEAVTNPRVARRDFGNDNLVQGQFRSKAEKPEAELTQTPRLRPGLKRPELNAGRATKKVSGDAHKDAFETKNVLRLQRALRVAKERSAFEKARLQARKDAGETKGTPEKDKNPGKPKDHDKN